MHKQQEHKPNLAELVQLDHKPATWCVQGEVQAAGSARAALDLRIRQLQSDCGEAERLRQLAHTNYENQVRVRACHAHGLAAVYDV